MSAISANGFITNSRSAMRGWGTIRSGSLICKSSKMSRSMSMILSLYTASFDFSMRPIRFSISCVCNSTSRGDNVVSTATTAFRKRFSDWNPHGAVS